MKATGLSVTQPYEINAALFLSLFFFVYLASPKTNFLSFDIKIQIRQHLSSSQLNPIIPFPNM
jgi:hypothetical protein